MDYTRKIRIEYYQVVKANVDGSGHDIIFDLRILINKAHTLGMVGRTYQYYQEEARLDKYRYNKTLDVWYLNFVRLRQTKLPVKATKTDAATSMSLGINEYIGEDVTAIYDCKNNIIALQRNRDSLSAGGLEAYLTELHGVQGEGIYLRPIPVPNAFDKARNAKSVRKLVLKFASSRANRRVNAEISSFKGLLDYFDRFGAAKSAVVSVSLGRSRKGTLDEEMVAQTLQDISMCEGFIEGAEVSIKEREDAPTEIIDLFSMKYHSFILMKVKRGESIDFMECADAIFNKYQGKRAEILRLIENA
ncbi:MAG: hypothetical protein E7260_10085 [Lachnospiraceae bacterium]|nr:hypothetical protein [Lachnospiraceae bacterium]